MELRYNERLYGSKEVRFFKINDLLISIVAIKEIDNLALHKFSGFVKYYKCKKGLIINFNSTIIDFRFMMI